MLAAYIAVAVLTIAANASAAYQSVSGSDSVVAIADRLRLSRSLMLPLGAILATGALGVAVGFALEPIGTAAAAGLVLYFICALGAHARARDAGIGGAVVYLVLAVATLALGIAERGAW